MMAPLKKLFSALFLVAVMFFIIPTHPAHALKFSNQFVEFELPTTNWTCALEGAEWVCQSTDEKNKRDAIIVLAAKLKGDQDTLVKYQEYLTKARTFSGPTGKSMTSQPKYEKINEINGHPWVDSMHLESEIPGFYTRYLATVKQDIAVLVTYSINKNKYQDYLAQFNDMTKSLKVFRKPGGMNVAATQSIFQQTQLPGSFTAQNVFPENQAQAPTAETTPKPAKKEDNSMLYLLLLVAVVGFIIWKKKRSGG